VSRRNRLMKKLFEKSARRIVHEGWSLFTGQIVAGQNTTKLFVPTQSNQTAL
jgi:hypothetical protein